MESIRCCRCNKLLAKVGAYSDLEIKCPRCGTLNITQGKSPALERRRASTPEARYERVKIRAAKAHT